MQMLFLSDEGAHLSGCRRAVPVSLACVIVRLSIMIAEDYAANIVLLVMSDSPYAAG